MEKIQQDRNIKYPPTIYRSMDELRQAGKEKIDYAEIFAVLRRLIGKDVNLEVHVYRYGRREFVIGDETFVYQIHIEHGMGIPYVRTLDLRNPYWRQALQEIYPTAFFNGEMKHIYPTLIELFDNPADAERFYMYNILSSAGIFVGDSVPAEYMVLNFYGDDDTNPKIEQVIDLIRQYWSPLLKPDYHIEFSDCGAFASKLRLVPMNQDAKEAMWLDGDKFISVKKKLIDGYDDMIQFLKSNAK